MSLLKKNPEIRQNEDKRNEVISLIKTGLQELNQKFLHDVSKHLDLIVVRAAEIEKEQLEQLVEIKSDLASAVDKNSQLTRDLSRCKAELESKSKEVDDVKRLLDEKNYRLQQLEACQATNLEAFSQLSQIVSKVGGGASVADITETLKKEIIQRDNRLAQLEEDIGLRDEQLTRIEADLRNVSEKLNKKENELKECRLELQISKKLTHTTKIRQLEKLKPIEEITSTIERLRKEISAVNRNIEDSNCVRKQSDGCHSVDDPDKMTKPKSSLPAHLQRLQEVRQQVISMLEAKKVACSMFQSSALAIGELESVLSSKTYIETATTLVDFVMREKSEAEVYFRFLDALNASGQHHIWKLLSFADQNIDDEHVKLIRIHYSYLTKNLDLVNLGLLDELYSREVIDQIDMEDLNCEPIPSRRVWKLLLMLSKKSAKQFDVFLEVLETIHQQQHIVHHLRGIHSGSMSVKHVIPADGRGKVIDVTSVNNQLFVLRKPSGQEIEVYDAETFFKLQKLRVDGLSDISSNSLTSCIRKNCLYVGDGDNKTVYKVKLTTGKKLFKWTVGRQPKGLSVNIACNLLVTCFGSKIFEYTTGGQLIREIEIKNPDGGLPSSYSLQHSIELTGGQFVVCHDTGDVIVVDKEGRLVYSYNNNKQSTDHQMKGPGRLAVDKNDCILVADTFSNRVLMLNSSLNCARDLPVTLDGGLNSPQCLHYDESRGRLLIGEYGGEKRVIVIDNIWSFKPT